MQRHSPSVSYPLQCSGVLRIVWWLSVLGSACVLLLWWWLGAGYGVQQLWVVSVSGLVWLVCSVLGWRALQSQRQGVLRYTGVVWEWVSAKGCLPLKAGPAVLFDVQSLLVIALEVDGVEDVSTRRFVLQREWAPDAWADLRRAVYSSNYPTHDAAENQQP